MTSTASSAERPTARPTLVAVARLAGVSPSTASLAFSGDGPVSDATREKVLAAAEQLGYAGPDPRARSLRRGRSGIVAVVIEDTLAEAFRDPVNIAMLDGIAEELGTAGLALLLLTGNGGELVDITSAPMDAAVLIGCSVNFDAAVATVQRRGTAVVTIEAREMPGVAGVDLDNRQASATAADYLRGLGHTTIAVVTLPLSAQGASGELPADWRETAMSHTTSERLIGVADVLGELRGRVAFGSSPEAGEEAARALLAGPDRPTAIIAQSDLLATGIIREAVRTGIRVPEDLSVVGFDGIASERTDGITLTTLVQPATAKGRAAGRAVIDLLVGREPERVVFTSELRIGDTTAAR